MQVKDLNWPVKISTTVHASAREVWQLISTPGNLEKFHPYCAKILLNIGKSITQKMRFIITAV